MSYLDSAQEGYDGRYAVFAPPNVETATKRELITEYRSISEVKTNKTIEFNVPNSSLYYIDLSRSKLCIKVRIIKGVERVGKSNEVGLINNALHSIWNQVDVTLNQTPIGSEMGRHYAYKSILDSLLYCSTAELESKGQASFFYKDTAGAMDNPSIANMNKGLFKRFEMTYTGDEVQLEGVMNHDVMSIKQFIPNGVGINIKLYPARNEFALMSVEEDQDYKVDVTDVTFKVQYIEPTNQLLIGHAEALSKSPAIFPYTKSIIKPSTIPAYVQTWSVDTLFANEIPDTLIVAMVDSEAYTGSYNLNPFNFQHFGLTNLTFYIEGFPMNSTSFSPDFDKKHYSTEYLSLFEGLSEEERVRGVGNIINYKDFATGYAIFKINISDGLRKNFTPLCQRGQTRLRFRFKEQLKRPVSVICYGKVSSVLQIDKAKNVISY